jgi:hypothetical protein
MDHSARHDPPDLSEAALVVDELPASAHTALAHNTIKAVCLYAESNDVAVLERFAEQVLASLQLHREPVYQKVFVDAPERPVGTLRSVDEVFAHLA